MNGKYIISEILFQCEGCLLRYVKISRKRNAGNFCFSVIDALMHCTELIRILY